MTPHDLLEGIGEVDEKLIRLAEAQPETNKNNDIIKYIKWGCIAAGILIVIGALIWATKSGFLRIDPLNTDPSSLYASQPESDEMIESVESTSEVVPDSEESVETSEGNTTEETDESNKKSRDIMRVVPIEAKPKMMQVRYAEDQLEYTPSIPAYKLNADLSNLANSEWFWIGDGCKEKLVTNGFVVAETSWIDEFYEIYEKNRYGLIPSFVTTDSLMHTYHLYFLKLQKSTEKQYLYNTLCGLTDEMLDRSICQYENLKGSEWEESAKRNVAYFGVAARLLDSKMGIPAEIEETISEEVNKIMAAEQIETCLITPENAQSTNPLIPSGEDYTQYKPRSYYAGDEQLEKYFRAMMWYGRITFTQVYEQQNRSALLIQLAMSDEKCYSDWHSIYEVTSFLTGGSDDLNYDDYMPVIKECYGTDFTIDSIIGNEEAWAKYVASIKQLRDPEINSTVFVKNPEEPNVEWKDAAKGYRFMGQRFSMDGAILQNLMYDKVLPTADEQKRKLPDALDVPAAFGSDVALNILVKAGNDKYPNYMEKMEEMRAKVASATSYWSSSIVAGWQFTLMPVLEKKGDGYPSFMTNTEWQKRSIEGFIGSWTELKHDTILYSKQPYSASENGGGYEDEREPDNRGYVEPEPEVYARLATLTKATKEGMQNLGYISSEDVESLDRLIEVCNTLRDISIRELNNESLTDYDYMFIEEYGGMLEHFWEEAMEAGSEYDKNLNELEMMLKENGCDEKMDPNVQIIADVATDPENGLCLEEALGAVSQIYVVFPIDGELHMGVGAVYNHYQFEQPINDRLTDQQWRTMMGYDPDENGEYHFDERDEMTKPVWTDSYTDPEMDVIYYEW